MTDARRVPRCWHCNGKLSNLNSADKSYWFNTLELEPGRTVKVHKCCMNAAQESIRKITAQPSEIAHD